MEKSYKEYLKQINTIVFDVDGVLTDGSILVTTTGEMLRRMHTKDGFALKTAFEQGLHVCIISGGTNLGVQRRLEGLGLTDIYLGASQKKEVLASYIKERNLQWKNVLFMGDDIPDLSVMKAVGLPCCPQDAVAEIKEISSYVSHNKGGEGCVRDIIEQVLKVQGKWLNNEAVSAKYD